MNPKEKKLVDDLCGKNGGFYTEDFYEIEVVDETAVKKLVNYISNVHQFRPSDKAIRIYKEDRMSSVFIFKMLAAILKKTRRFDVKYGIANAVCHTFLEKEKEFFFWYAYEDDEFCKIFMHYYDKKNQHTRYRILCYLMAVMHYIHGAGFDEKIMIDHFGIDWWQLPVDHDH